MLDYLNEDGSFDQEKLATQIGTIAGEEHKGTKAFEAIPNVDTLVKAYADTKSAYGKKLEGVRQKPGEKATDQEKTEYRQSLLKELGAPDSEDSYEFPRVEGMDYTDTMQAREKDWRTFFKQLGMPEDFVKAIVEKQNTEVVAFQKAQADAETVAFEAEAKSLRTEWQGDNLVKNLKTAYAAIMEFGTKDWTDPLKAAKLYDSAGDLNKWRELKFSPEQLRWWYNIGVKMKSAEHLSDEGSGAKGGSEKTTGQKALAGVYTHPDSQAMVNKSNL